MKMKKIITENLLVFTMLVFMVSPAMAAATEPEDVMDNKPNVFQSGKRYAINMTGKEATSIITELLTTNPNTPVSDGNDTDMEQLKMILLILCMPGPWQGISMNLQLQ